MMRGLAQETSVGFPLPSDVEMLGAIQNTDTSYMKPRRPDSWSTITISA